MPSSLRRGVATALLLSLAGCHVAPRVPLSEPRPRIPANWPTQAKVVRPAANTAPRTSATRLYWHQFYRNTELQSLIRSALRNNRDMRLAVLRVQEARAAHSLQVSDGFPSMAMGGSFARSHVPGDLNITRRPQTSGNHEVSVGLNSWELDFWGRVRNLNEAALYNYLATEAGQQATQTSLIHQVARNYLALRGLDTRIDLAKKSIASREESLRIFKRRVEVGSASRYALAQAQTLLHQAQVMGSQLEQQRSIQANALELLTGVPAPTPASIDLALAMQDLPEGLPSDLIVNRPDITSAEYALKASQANVEAARAAFLPRITLIGRTGTASEQFSGLFKSGSSAWQFVPSISVPIFDNGALRANLGVKAVRQNIAVAQYEKQIETALREVHDALASRALLNEQVDVLQQQYDSLKERRRLAGLRFDSGASPYFDVLDAERELLTAEQQLAQGREHAVSAQVDLFAALGGGAPRISRTPFARKAAPTSTLPQHSP